MIFTKYLYISFWFNFIVSSRGFSTPYYYNLQIVHIKKLVGQN